MQFEHKNKGVCSSAVHFEIEDNIVKNVQEGSCSIYHGAIRIGACTISGVEITGNLVEGAQVGIYNGAAIKEGSNGEIEISGNALAVNQIHPFEAGVTPEFSGLGGTGIPEGTASKNNVIQGTEFTASTDTSVIYVKENWSFLENGDNVLVGDKVLTIGTNAFADVNAAKEEMMTEPVTTILNSRNKRPVVPSINTIGKNTATKVMVVEITAKKISLEPSIPASFGDIPFSMRM